MGYYYFYQIILSYFYELNGKESNFRISWIILTKTAVRTSRISYVQFI
jgi:ribosomal protein L20